MGSESTERLTLDQLMSMLDNGLDVYRHYYPLATGKELGRLNTKMLSPFREEEDPSFSIFYHKQKGTVFFKDHGNDFLGSVWTFVMKLYGLDFKQAIEKVKSDILGINDNNEIVNPKIISIIRASRSTPIRRSNSRVEIHTWPRDWTENDLFFFKDAGISLPTLEDFHANPLSSFDIKKDDKTVSILSRDSDPIYGYTMPKSGRHKIYRPFSHDPKFKWTSNLVADEDVFGLDLIPKNCENLFIIGGNRDCMSFHENIGHPVIALASESATLTDELYSFLRHIVKNIFVLYDNDKQGYKKADMFHEQFGIPSLNHLYEKFSCNDFVEVYKSGSINDFRFILNEEINKMNIS